LKFCRLRLVDDGYLRIGELARRVGIRPELLRAWETRYGLLTPSRSSGGYRLYSDDDEQRVRAMRAELAGGLSAAEAARRVLTAPPGPAAAAADGPLEHTASDLRAALDAYDEPRAHAAFDELLAAYSLETVLGRVVLPYLGELGDRWARGDASVAQEHFASNLLRGRLLGLARGWGQGAGPRALLACAPGEQHDLGLVVFGLALRGRGWRVTFLGPNTPAETLAEAAEALDPDLVVVTAATAAPLRKAAPELARLARGRRLARGGRGAGGRLADSIGAELLEADPLTEAARLAA
jgi:DNA-binding transcriptional MerR regulator/methylmalonyl-CoA mutase cobalamin-binding subunit